MEPVIKGEWVEGQRIHLTHPAGDSITTDGLPEFGGGRGFSPTDLIAAELGACALSVAVIVGQRQGHEMAGAYMESTRRLASRPLRISEIQIVLHLPRAIPSGDRMKLQQAAHHCPGHESLMAEIAVHFDFQYDVYRAEIAASAAS